MIARNPINAPIEDIFTKKNAKELGGNINTTRDKGINSLKSLVEKLGAAKIRKGIAELFEQGDKESAASIDSIAIK